MEGGLGHALGGGAHLIGLRRSAVGPFPIEEAATLEQLQADEALAPRRVLELFCLTVLNLNEFVFID